MPKIKLKNRKDMIPGGLADKRQPNDFNSKALKKGLKVELEHTRDPNIALEIAMDHLAEDPAYYDKLAKMEKGELKEMKLKIRKKTLKENLQLEQEVVPPVDFSGEPDYEGEMADSQLLKVHKYSKELMAMISDEMQLPAWVQSKLTKVADYMGAVKHYLEGEMQLSEEAKPDYLDFDKDGDKEEPMKKALKDKEESKKKVNEELCDSLVYEGQDEDGNSCLVEMFYEECGCGHMEKQLIEEAEYQGRKVKLNKPMRGDVKKFKVFVKDPKTGNVKKVNFGDPNMRIKKSNPKRRKSFRARHNCDNPGPKTKARYWSCRAWEE